MVDYLQRKGNDQVGLFVQSGVQEVFFFFLERDLTVRSLSYLSWFFFLGNGLYSRVFGHK